MLTTPRNIFTIGHSTRTFDEFLNLLKAHQVRALADVRLIPRSRRFPHFNDDAMESSLQAAGIQYVGMKSLGGRRRAQPDSTNLAWKNEAFRGYADFMQTEEFQRALEDLMSLAASKITCIMCAEAVPWRCHRQLIADALVARGWQVIDILSATSAKPHALTKFARVRDERVDYPASEQTLF